METPVLCLKISICFVLTSAEYVRHCIAPKFRRRSFFATCWGRSCCLKFVDHKFGAKPETVNRFFGGHEGSVYWKLSAESVSRKTCACA
ncbi:hypothetical protein CPB85DRAFT_1299132 [Mucidula mucida]|nr:hypothetical protein CPB85DRAFT_1299132 [Mucidula mucida]